MPKTDSIISAEERAKAIRAEAAKIAKEQAAEAERQAAHQARQDAKARDVEEEDIKKVADVVGGIYGEIGTRDQLLDRIRAMREDVPKEPERVGYRTQRQLDELKAEQEMGRAMVAKAEAEIEWGREVRRKMAEEDALRQRAKEELRMQQVVHPNPGMNQEFPAQKATLGKPR
jgi:hypothetical protein